MGMPGVTALAHRVSWVLTNGSIPHGLCVIHYCDNRMCVRPDHLRLGTVRENNTDKVLKGRARGGRPWRNITGEHHPAHKVTLRQVLSIRHSLLSGVSLSSLGRKHGLSISAVANIRDRKSWP
jgi:hypothetical protein